MKKIFKATAFVLPSLLFCSCVQNVSTDGLVTTTSASNPFNTSQTTDDSNNWDDGMGEMGFGYTNWSVTEEYTGGELNISFTRHAFGSSDECEEGYMVYLGGVPQLLSLNGGEKAEMVSFSQKLETEETVIITFTPMITEDLKEEESLQLDLYSIAAPSYNVNPESNSVSVDHTGCLLTKRVISFKSPIEEITEEGNALEEYESILITNTERVQYNIISDLDRFTRFFLYPVDGEDELVYCLPEGENSIELDMVIFGRDNYRYRIFFYQNNQRVKFNGDYDYLDIDLQSGYLDRCRVKFENVNNRDIIYAVAVDLDAPADAFVVVKSFDCLILSETDHAYQEYLKNK